MELVHGLLLGSDLRLEIGDRALELPDPLPECATELRQATWTEYDEEHEQDKYDLAKPQATERHDKSSENIY
jgi:hypothetical protein